MAFYGYDLWRSHSQESREDDNDNDQSFLQEEYTTTVSWIPEKEDDDEERKTSMKSSLYEEKGPDDHVITTDFDTQPRIVLPVTDSATGGATQSFSLEESQISDSDVESGASLENEAPRQALSEELAVPDEEQEMKTSSTEDILEELTFVPVEGTGESTATSVEVADLILKEITLPFEYKEVIMSSGESSGLEISEIRGSRGTGKCLSRTEKSFSDKEFEHETSQKSATIELQKREIVSVPCTTINTGAASAVAPSADETESPPDGKTNLPDVDKNLTRIKFWRKRVSKGRFDENSGHETESLDRITRDRKSKKKSIIRRMSSMMNPFKRKDKKEKSRAMKNDADSACLKADSASKINAPSRVSSSDMCPGSLKNIPIVEIEALNNTRTVSRDSVKPASSTVFLNKKISDASMTSSTTSSSDESQKIVNLLKNLKLNVKDGRKLSPIGEDETPPAPVGLFLPPPGKTPWSSTQQKADKTNVSSSLSVNGLQTSLDDNRLQTSEHDAVAFDDHFGEQNGVSKEDFPWPTFPSSLCDQTPWRKDQWSEENESPWVIAMKEDNYVNPARLHTDVGDMNELKSRAFSTHFIDDQEPPFLPLTRVETGSVEETQESPAADLDHEKEGSPGAEPKKKKKWQRFHVVTSLFTHWKKKNLPDH